MTNPECTTTKSAHSSLPNIILGVPPLRRGRAIRYKAITLTSATLRFGSWPFRYYPSPMRRERISVLPEPFSDIAAHKKNNMMILSNNSKNII
ncbi:MAG: hypothetical protein H6Q20_362 [Bacteroidetes bacterium]|nr:hypothetical protein [Bacteroidota bacterium]